jgi:hypothetical protein
MNRIRNIAAVVLGAALAAGAAGTASAQSPDPQQKPTDSPQHPSDKAAGSKEQSQEKLDREKVTLKDRVQDAIGIADSNIDALKKIGDTAKGPAKQHGADVEKKLTDLKDTLKKDLDKIDKATPSDWSSVHAGVTKNLNAMDTELKTASNVTHLPLPTGAANKQPEGTTNKQPAPKPAPEKTNP